MKNTKLLRVLSLFLCVVLITAMALTLESCTKHEEKDEKPSESVTAEAAETVGKGEKEFSLTVKYDGKEKHFTVKTDRKTVGDALSELGLIEGDDAEYGLYIKKVDGVVADYDKDGTYWAFYINGEYAMSGIDRTDITEGSEFTLSKEK